MQTASYTKNYELMRSKSAIPLPASWVFYTVWNFLYGTMLVFGITLTKEEWSQLKWYILSYLALNFSWTYIWFGRKQKGLGVISIVLQLLLVILIVHKLSGAEKGQWKRYVLLPLLAWTGFALVISLAAYALPHEPNQ